MREWGIVCNVTDEAPLREGARVIIQAWGHDRARVFGLSLGGRKISKWVKLAHLLNRRPRWLPPKSRGSFLFESKAEAAKFFA